MGKQYLRNSAAMVLTKGEIIYLMKLVDKDRKYLSWERYTPTYYKLERHLNRIMRGKVNE